MKIKPFPHQEQAIKAVLKEFKANDRCHIVMACGTGKTLAALGISEKIKAKTIVVFVPSLALINQFMKEWLQFSSWENLRTLAVCSDQDVTTDVEGDSLLFENIDFPVSNNHKEIKEFVASNKDNTKIIFSTYQSATALSNIKFDLGIFDEAHKTAGYDKELFSFSLHDENIKIKKRLFMTATPRHAHAVRLDRYGDKQSIYSMDNKDVYGERAFTLGFREAINMGLICDYKIIISVTKDHKSAANDFGLQSNIAALKDAVKKTKAKKIITYHRSVHGAKLFIENVISSNAFAKHKALHISGELPMKERTKVMTTFKSSPEAIISNARCLTEGVDVPSIDMVSFLNPRSSKIDIVQAIGRALRTSPNKSLGYIFLLVFLKEAEGQDIKDSIKGSDFSHIWDVLNALSEQDMDLNDIIKDISRKAGESGATPDYSLLNRFILIDEDIDLINSISSRILENHYSDWDKMFGQLCAYKKKHGNCRVPDSRLCQGLLKSLSHWIRGQRDHKKNKFISQRRVDLLNSINFDWEPNEADWQDKYSDLLAFYKKFGHTKIPHRHGCPYVKLSKWVNQNRRAYDKGYLTLDRQELLKKVDFDFSEIKKIVPMFDTGYPKLLEYIAEHGKKYTKLGGIDVLQSTYLKGWVRIMRERYKLGQLPPDQIKKLEEINIVWDPAESLWQSTFDKYCIALDNKEKLNSSFASWVAVQRKNFANGSLDEQKIKKLQKINFIFECPVDYRTEKYVQFYERFIKAKKDIREDDKLYGWVMSMYRKKAANELSPDVIKRLKKAYFNWKHPKKGDYMLRDDKGRIKTSSWKASQ